MYSSAKSCFFNIIYFSVVAVASPYSGLMDGVKVKVNVKVKFTLEQATKTLMGSRDIALLFL